MRGSALRVAIAVALLALVGVGVAIARMRARAPARPPPLVTPPEPSAVAPAPPSGAPAPTPTRAVPPPPAPAPRDAAPISDDEPRTLPEQRAALLARMTTELELSAAAAASVRDIFDASPVIGQGNPRVTVHPMKRSECRAVRAAAGLTDGGDPGCGARYMAPVFDPAAGETAASARLCVDQFEFPGIPCEYPVVNVRSSEAASLCAAVGKRLCDAHEWEGACAGALRRPEVEYRFGQPRLQMTHAHNQRREVRWAYGTKKAHAKCATAGKKSKNCVDSGWHCGSNTWPAGSFPECRSPFGVFDLHGNAAEHMSLPTKPEELASAGGAGQTEMKGSWFIFAWIEPHDDDCRWRAKDWHPSKVMDPNSHRNYHLGFRCCKDVTR